MLESGRTDATIVTLARVLIALGVGSVRIADGEVDLEFPDATDTPVSGGRPSRAAATDTDSRGGPGPQDTVLFHDRVLQTVGGAVARRRRELGLSQEQVAEATGLHHNTIGEVERAAEDPTISTLLRICSVLKTEGLSASPEGLSLR